MIDVKEFTYEETLAASDELGISLTPHQAMTIAVKIVTTKFPVCVREYLKNDQAL